MPDELGQTIDYIAGLPAGMPPVPPGFGGTVMADPNAPASAAGVILGPQPVAGYDYAGNPDPGSAPSAPAPVSASGTVNAPPPPMASGIGSHNGPADLGAPDASAGSGPTQVVTGQPAWREG